MYAEVAGPDLRPRPSTVLVSSFSARHTSPIQRQACLRSVLIPWPSVRPSEADEACIRHSKRTRRTTFTSVCTEHDQSFSRRRSKWDQ